MRVFDDQEGVSWVARVRERTGHDYKGRYYLALAPVGGGEEVALEDVRWNSERTAQRTLETMSGWELNRRLRSAVGRATASAG